jgi:serine-type D-Ala-D-Ala carboxypeptidase/endopeptidase (penicillin-binding protein 4)
MRLKVGLIAVAGALLLAGPARAEAAPTLGQPPVQQLPGPDLPTRSSAAAAPQATASNKVSRGQLRRKLERLARKAPGASGVFVSDLEAERRRVLFKRKEGKRRKLASNTKLFTTATALQRLGAKGRIETAVKARGRIGERGRLDGDLYLIGGGDPALGAAGLRSLAKQVQQAGIKRVTGHLFADDSVFDRRRGVPASGWGPSPYIAPLSGLVYGGSTYSGDPAEAAAQAFKKALRKRGVRVKRSIKRRQVRGKTESRAPIAVTRSPTIASLVEATNEPSNNFYAEMLLKRLWATGERQGTTPGGAKAVQRFARSAGSRIDARDGSGLTAANRSSPRDVVRLLAAMQGHRDARAFYESLPQAGREGTLVGRMKGTAAEGRCRAKTGTISGVSALSGYCNAGHGTIAFSILMNGVSSYDAARNLQDKMAATIARYRP